MPSHLAPDGQICRSGRVATTAGKGAACMGMMAVSTCSDCNAVVTAPTHVAAGAARVIGEEG